MVLDVMLAEALEADLALNSFFQDSCPILHFVVVVLVIATAEISRISSFLFDAKFFERFLEMAEIIALVDQKHVSFEGGLVVQN